MSTLKRTLNMTPPITDEFMDILETSEEVSINDFVSSQEDMKTLLQVLSSSFEKFLINRVKPHAYHTNITETCWPINYKKRRITYRQCQKHMSQGRLYFKLMKKFIRKGYE